MNDLAEFIDLKLVTQSFFFPLKFLNHNTHFHFGTLK